MQKLLDSIDVSRLVTTAVEFLPKLGTAIAILALFFVIYRSTRRLLRAVMTRGGLHEALIHLLVDNVYRYALMVFGIVMAVDQLGVNVGAALAGLGIAGIAVGFAAQDSVANVFSGIVIFWDKPFIVGDWVQTGEHYGRVSEITLRSTRIRTPRNTYVVIPNKHMVDTTLENFSKHGELRVDVPVGIAYKEDILAARRVLLDAMREVEGVREHPAPDVVVDALGNSSVDLLVRVWIDHGEQRQPVQVAVVEAAKLALDAAGIEIPFPHLQLFVDDIRPRVWDSAARFRAND